MIELLFGKGADINAQGEWYGNAMLILSFEGHETMVELPLDKGDVNALLSASSQSP